MKESNPNKRRRGPLQWLRLKPSLKKDSILRSAPNSPWNSGPRPLLRPDASPLATPAYPQRERACQPIRLCSANLCYSTQGKKREEDALRSPLEHNKRVLDDGPWHRHPTQGSSRQAGYSLQRSPANRFRSKQTAPRGAKFGTVCKNIQRRSCDRRVHPSVTDEQKDPINSKPLL